jgi:multiple sugar transport system ATP-binding protein
MRTEIKELHQRLATTSIYVTHDQIEAMTMADKIVVMKDGLVEQTGDPLTLYDAPVNTFVAGFIGSPAMNMIPGIARGSGDRGTIEFGGDAVLPMPLNARAADGQEVLFGMRPEHCSLADSGGLPADVVVVEPTGADTQLYCRFHGQEVTSLVRDRVTCRAGDIVRLSPDLKRAHLFDRASGLSLAA